MTKRPSLYATLWRSHTSDLSRQTSLESHPSYTPHQPSKSRCTFWLQLTSPILRLPLASTAFSSILLPKKRVSRHCFLFIRRPLFGDPQAPHPANLLGSYGLSYDGWHRPHRNSQGVTALETYGHLQGGKGKRGRSLFDRPITRDSSPTPMGVGTNRFPKHTSGVVEMLEDRNGGPPFLGGPAMYPSWPQPSTRWT